MTSQEVAFHRKTEKKKSEVISKSEANRPRAFGKRWVVESTGWDSGKLDGVDPDSGIHSSNQRIYPRYFHIFQNGKIIPTS